MNQKTLFWAVLVLAAAVLLYMFLGGNGTDVVEDQEAEVESQEEVDTTEEVAGEAVVGTWQSQDDEKAVLVLGADGTYEDRYDGEVVGEGTWSVSGTLADASGIDQAELDFANDIYLTKTSTDGEALYYNVAAYSENELIITYLLGDVLRFERVE